MSSPRDSRVPVALLGFLVLYRGLFSSPLFAGSDRDSTVLYENPALGRQSYKTYIPWTPPEITFFHHTLKLFNLPNQQTLKHKALIIILLVCTMSLISSIPTTAPFRVAIRPTTYFHLASRAYSGVAVKGINGSSRANRNLAPFTCTSKRPISSTPQNQIKEFFPPTKEPGVKEVETAWVHPV